MKTMQLHNQGLASRGKGNTTRRVENVEVRMRRKKTGRSKIAGDTGPKTPESRRSEMPRADPVQDRSGVFQPAKLAKILNESHALVAKKSPNSPQGAPSQEDLEHFIDKYSPGGRISATSLPAEVCLVRDTYNRVVDLVSKRSKKDEETFPIRNANNFLKSILYARYMPRGKVVMNLGCGKGPDMYKDKYCKPSTVIFVDVSERCLYEAERRWRRIKYPFPATFVQADFCSPDFLKGRDLVIYQESAERKRGEQRTPTVGTVVSTGDAADFVDAISCQFACHYAFYSEESASRFIDNVHRVLKPGGMFIGTAPQGEQIVKILNEVKGGSTHDSGKCSMWLDEETCAKYEGKQITSSFVPYWFYMKDTIRSKQWTMCVADLVRLCESRGLKMIYMNNLRCEYEKEIVNMRNQGVMERMGINDTRLDEVDMKTISIYFMFVFVKQAK